jgi:hypothetical protein
MAVQRQNGMPPHPATYRDQGGVSYAQPQRRVRVNAYHFGAILAQVGSYLTTYAFFLAVLKGMQLPLVIGIALAAEFLLFLGKGLLFNSRRHDGAAGWASVLIDTLLNAGGLWPYVTRVADTPTAKMIVEAFGLRGTMGHVSAFLLTLVAGYMLAVAPHRIWRAARR